MPSLKTIFVSPDPTLFSEADRFARGAEGGGAPPRPAGADRLDNSRSLYQLNLRARRLKLVEGFQQLISLSTLRQVESFSHQTETALRVLRRFQGRALLCDEVGLGKTVEAGLVFKEYVLRGLVRKALVLAPPGLVEQWKEEMSVKFGLQCLSPEDADFSEHGPRAWADCPYVVASLSLAKRSPHAEAIAGVSYDLVIVDEAHRLRNRASVAWKFVNGLKKKFLLLLTATPVQNDLDELYNLVTLLKPGQLQTPREFRSRFVESGDPRKPKNTEALRALLAECMVRNTRSQIDKRLPPRRAHTVRLAPLPAEKELYGRVTERLRSLAPSTEEGGAPRRPWTKPLLRTLQKEMGSSPAAFAETVRRLLEHPALAEDDRRFFGDAARDAETIRETGKSRALVSLVESMPGEKLVIFTGYRRTLEDIRSLLEARGCRLAIYHGGLTRAQKDEAVRSFREDVPIFLSTEAGGEGRNLQFCRVLINHDLPYNPMKIEQRVGRIHRIGQTEPVSIYNLAAEGTLEDSLIRLLDEKINMFEMVVGEMDMVLGQMEDQGDFEELLLDLWWRARSPEEWNASLDGLGRRLQGAKEAYLSAKTLDDAIFEQDFEAV